MRRSGANLDFGLETAVSPLGEARYHPELPGEAIVEPMFALCPCAQDVTRNAATVCASSVHDSLARNSSYVNSLTILNSPAFVHTPMLGCLTPLKNVVLTIV